MPFPRLHPTHLHPYRLFHLSARLRLRDRPTPTSQSPSEDDYYSLLLSHPTPTPAQKSINPAPRPKSSNPTSSPTPSAASLPPTVQGSQGIQGSDKDISVKAPDNRVLFSAPLAGPSARMRGLMRGEKGLGRPPEPENCCMSGCVNCVWDAYREEVEEWAVARRGGGGEGKRAGSEGEGSVGVGDLDGVGGMGLEGGLFEGVPVGIREFMITEKRLRDRREAEVKG